MSLTVNGSLNIDYVPPPAAETIAADNGARDIVMEGWNSAKLYANSAYSNSVGFLNRLEALARSMVEPSVNVNLDILNLDIAAFNNLIGTAPVAPGNTFAFTEIPYSANLLTDLRARLLEWVNGTATGILPSVEQAIYDRGRAREAAVMNLKSQTAIRSFAMRGFPKPSGALSLELNDAAQVAQDAALTLSRDIIIKQAELEQSNRRFSLEQAWKVEEGAIAYTNQQMQRALETAKSFQQFAIEIYQQNVAAYGVGAQVYGARVGAETAAFAAKTGQNTAEANIRIEQARVQLQAWIQKLTMQVESVKAGAQVSTQLAASALSAVNLSGQLQDSTQNSASNNTNYQVANTASFGISGGASYNYSGDAGAG